MRVTIDLTADQVRVLILMCTLNQPIELEENDIAELPEIRVKLAAALRSIGS